MRHRFLIDVCARSRLDLDAEELRRVEQRFEATVWSDRGFLKSVLGGVLLILVVGWVIGTGLFWLMENVGAGEATAIAVAAVLTPASLAVVWFALFPRMMRRGVRKALRDCGHHVCVPCGYRLDGIPDSSPCPECGGRAHAHAGRRADASEPRPD